MKNGMTEHQMNTLANEETISNLGLCSQINIMLEICLLTHLSTILYIKILLMLLLWMLTTPKECFISAMSPLKLFTGKNLRLKKSISSIFKNELIKVVPTPTAIVCDFSLIYD